jgi:hypothetical protein
MRLWYPDFCPSGSCVIELTKEANGSTNWTSPKNIVTLCQHHTGVKNTHALDNAGIFTAIIQSSRVKEAARKAVKTELGLDKQHPGVPYRVNADGSFTVLTAAASLAWSGSLPSISSQTRTRARNAGLQAAALVAKPLGTSTLTGE